MTIKIKTIGIIAKDKSEAVIDTVKRLVDFISQKGCKIVFDKSTEGIINDADYVDRANLAGQSDLAIVVGGDGTFLSAVRSLADHNIPILGINLGRLGFLVDISPDDMLQHLDQILQGQYVNECRFLLEAQVERDGTIISQADAFNDVVVHIRDVARMIEFETYVNDQFVNYQRSDGLVISTPTGSTAYALSSGGPLLHATLDAMVIVPICPHTLTNRPLVINSNSKVEVVIGESKQSTAQVTFDGQTAFDVKPGDKIIVKKKKENIHLIHPASYDYYEILRAKLHWSEQL
ncbi:MAG: NAD(+) kinase [endosymbiont of Galathealinum brachiosum]|uniref:NAD kinase n=1 Tax=endosymbiont of Galathealinum brachiosum TaxID=2200906 RepID=A0A370DFY5_9GAMM|nr:MAG: NAD(+) kinase [endosymbiont of Galathealinum brachiosum]